MPRRAIFANLDEMRDERTGEPGLFRPATGFNDARENPICALSVLPRCLSARLSCARSGRARRSWPYCQRAAQPRFRTSVEFKSNGIGKTAWRLQDLDLAWNGYGSNGQPSPGVVGISSCVATRPGLPACSGRGGAIRVSDGPRCGKTAAPEGIGSAAGRSNVSCNARCS